MKNIAVLIQAHNNIEGIISFCQKFKKINFYVHYDKKSPLSLCQISMLSDNNIQLVTDRIDVHWGGFSQVKATLSLLNCAFKNHENQYFHLISGDCLPLIPFEEMSKLWDSYGDVACIDIRDRPEIYWRLNIRVPFSDNGNLRKLAYRVLNKFYKLLGSKYKFTTFPKEYYSYGSQWFSLKRNHVKTILNHESKYFINDFKNISCADEHVFQMISLKEGFNTTSNKRFIHFKNKSNSPKFLDVNELARARDEGFWFARKVSQENKERYLNERY